MSKKIILIFILGMVMINLISVQAFMPKFSHKLIWDKSIETPIDSEWYRACVKYPELCYSSLVLNDVSVIFYYTQRGKYTATHNPPFCKELLDNIAKIPGKDPERMRACAVGGCLHPAGDIASHSLTNGVGMVNYAITHSFLANNLVHVFSEQKLDSWLERQDPSIGKEAEDYLTYYKECQDLFTVSLMGEPAYSGMSKEELDTTFETFITEIRNSQDTGYNPGFENKSFFVTIQSIPFVILASYITVMLGFLLLIILLLFKVIKGDRRIRIWVGLIIFLPIFIVMAYLFIGSLQGSAFNNFIKVIKPISELVPIGGNQKYIDAGVQNTRELLSQGEGWLIGTDASGLSTKPVLSDADSQIMFVDYIFLFILVSVLIWFIWFVFKSNKINVGDTFNL